VGVGGRRHAAATHPPPTEWTGTVCTESCVDPTASPDRCGKSRLPTGFIPDLQSVTSRYTDWAVPAHLRDWSWSSFCYKGNFVTMAQQLPPPSRSGPPNCRVFTITLRHTTLGRTPLDEWSARRRDLYVTTHNNHDTICTPNGIRIRNPNKQAAADPPLKPIKEIKNCHSKCESGYEIFHLFLSMSDKLYNNNAGTKYFSIIWLHSPPPFLYACLALFLSAIYT